MHHRPEPRSATCMLALFGGLAFIASAVAMSTTTSAQWTGWRIVVLGIAQDAGIPHLQCQQELCVNARAGRRPTEKVASLGVVHSDGLAYLFDATPDFPAQVHALTGGRLPDGVFLTHGHMGHYTGLMYLGKESVGADGVPVYATFRMSDYLTANDPWSLLVEEGHIGINKIEPDSPIELGRGLRVTAFTVPHRDEFTDTVGYRIDGPRASALFIPDIDRWDRWDRDIRALVDGVDLAFLDGTFASTEEVQGRPYESIRHPLIPVTRRLLTGTPAAVWFIHLNHTNVELDRGTDIVQEGMSFDL